MPRGPARARRGASEGQPKAPHRLAADLEAMDLAELFRQVHVVKAEVGGGHELGDLGAELGRQPARRGLAAALMAQRWRPAALEAALEALEVPDGQMQGGGALAIRNAPRERGLDQAGPGQFLPAHRESLHEGMTLSRSSYPMTFSCSSSRGDGKT